jgi:hypothetical protein
MSGSATLTIASLVAEARSMLNDTVQTAGAAYRYSDADLLSYINGGIRDILARRPDALLAFGLRKSLTIFQESDITNATPWPIDPTLYNPVLYYTIGRAESREDTFTNDARAKMFIDKATSQVLKVEG